MSNESDSISAEDLTNTPVATGLQAVESKQNISS